MFSIEFNNYNSYKDLGLVVEQKPIIPCPQKNLNVIEIQGRNGTLIEDFGTYKDINISLNFGFAEKNNFEHKIRLIKSWLNNIENRKLILSSDTEVFYKVKYATTESIDRSIRTLGRFAVTFVCEPFCYLKEGLETITLYNKFSNPNDVNYCNIYNSGTFESQPHLKIFANDSIFFSINNRAINIKNINDYVEIDSEIMNCYKDMDFKNIDMNGEYPIFHTGENIIRFSNKISKIEIIPRWRCI